MSGQITEQDRQLWDDLVTAHLEAASANRPLDDDPRFLRFFEAGVDRVGLVRHGLTRGRGIPTVAWVLRRLERDELIALFDLLVEWSSSGHGYVQVFRDAIATLPRAWVRQRIESAAEPYLRQGTDDEYRRFLELYDRLGFKRHLRRLALRAAAHDDPEIAEAGVDFLVNLRNEEVRAIRAKLPDVSAEEFSYGFEASLARLLPAGGDLGRIDLARVAIDCKPFLNYLKTTNRALFHLLGPADARSPKTKGSSRTKGASLTDYLRSGQTIAMATMVAASLDSTARTAAIRHLVASQDYRIARTMKRLPADRRAMLLEELRATANARNDVETG